MDKTQARSSTKTWLLIYIVIPLLPFLIGGLIRWVVTGAFTLRTFSASDLAMSLGLLCFFVNQSLTNTELLLDNPDKEAENDWVALTYFCLAVLFLAFFGVLQVLDALAALDEGRGELERPIGIFAKIIFSLLLPMVVFSVLVQRSFKLRASVR